MSELILHQEKHSDDDSFLFNPRFLLCRFTKRLLRHLALVLPPELQSRQHYRRRPAVSLLLQVRNKPATHTLPTHSLSYTRTHRLLTAVKNCRWFKSGQTRNTTIRHGAIRKETRGEKQDSFVDYATPQVPEFKLRDLVG